MHFIKNSVITVFVESFMYSGLAAGPSRYCARHRTEPKQAAELRAAAGTGTRGCVRAPAIGSDGMLSEGKGLQRLQSGTAGCTRADTRAASPAEQRIPAQAPRRCSARCRPCEGRARLRRNSRLGVHADALGARPIMVGGSFRPRAVQSGLAARGDHGGVAGLRE